MKSQVHVRHCRRILCVFPRYAPSFGTFHHAYALMDGVRAFMPPQGILIIAAYLPEQWEVRLVDENTPLLAISRSYQKMLRNKQTDPKTRERIRFDSLANILQHHPAQGSEIFRRKEADAREKRHEGLEIDRDAPFLQHAVVQ